MAELTCKTSPHDPAWPKHLAEIKRLKLQAERANKVLLVLELASLLLAHKEAERNTNQQAARP